MANKNVTQPSSKKKPAGKTKALDAITITRTEFEELIESAPLDTALNDQLDKLEDRFGDGPISIHMTRHDEIEAIEQVADWFLMQNRQGRELMFRAIKLVKAREHHPERWKELQEGLEAYEGGAK